VSFTLRMFFSGLCVFVPTMKDGKQGMYVLLPDTTDAGQTSTGEEHMVHEASLSFRYSNLESSTAPYIASATGGIGKWVFAGDDLEIEVEGGECDKTSDLEIKKKSETTGFEKPTSVEERRAFSWLPEMKTLYAASGGLDAKPESLTHDDLRSVGLIARAFFDAGVIGSEPSSLTDDLVNFVPVSGETSSVAHAQSVAVCTSYELVINSDTIETPTAVTFRSRQRGTHITLRPDWNVSLEVSIQNMAPEDEKPVIEVKTDQGSVNVRDTDFELIYKLVASQPSVMLVPEVPGDGTSTTQVTTRKRCFGASLNPIELP
jgi:hypothetical protein